MRENSVRCVRCGVRDEPDNLWSWQQTVGERVCDDCGCDIAYERDLERRTYQVAPDTQGHGTARNASADRSCNSPGMNNKKGHSA